MTIFTSIRFTASATKSAFGSLQLQLHVKPGVSKQREGILSITDAVIEVCVSAQAREGEANRAVKMLFSKILKIPKSNVEVIRGLKSRDKILMITGIDAKDECLYIATIKRQLQDSTEK